MPAPLPQPPAAHGRAIYNQSSCLHVQMIVEWFRLQHNRRRQQGGCCQLDEMMGAQRGLANEGDRCLLPDSQSDDRRMDVVEAQRLPAANEQGCEW